MLEVIFYQVMLHFDDFQKAFPEQTGILKKMVELREEFVKAFPKELGDKIDYKQILQVCSACCDTFPIHELEAIDGNEHLGKKQWLYFCRECREEIRSGK